MTNYQHLPPFPSTYPPPSSSLPASTTSVSSNSTSGYFPKNDSTDETIESSSASIDFHTHRYPYCVVWTPIPMLTWFLPFIGHMGICTSKGVIRDFAGPYYVSTDRMGFGNPTRYLELNPDFVTSTQHSWDDAVTKSSEEYCHRMHNLFCDNCHSHVALALNLMKYKSSSWNAWKIGIYFFFCAKFVGMSGFLKTWLPFLFILSFVLLLAFLL